MTEAANSLGSFLKEKRKMKGYSLRDVEELKSISNAYLSQIENGKIKKPSANILYKLSQLYEVPFDLLLKVSGIINNNREENRNYPKTATGHALFSENLTEEEEKQLTEYLKFIRQQKDEKR